MHISSEPPRVAPGWWLLFCLREPRRSRNSTILESGPQKPYQMWISSHSSTTALCPDTMRCLSWAQKKECILGQMPRPHLLQAVSLLGSTNCAMNVWCVSRNSVCTVTDPLDKECRRPLRPSSLTSHVPGGSSSPELRTILLL